MEAVRPSPVASPPPAGEPPAGQPFAHWLWLYAFSGFVALSLAVQRLHKLRKLKANPIHGQIASVSVGIYKGVPVLDLDYAEDSSAQVDLNLGADETGRIVEVQATGEGDTFSADDLARLCRALREILG